MRHWPDLAPLLPVFLLEAFFYFFSLFPQLESRFGRLPAFWKASLISGSAVLPVFLLQLLAGRPLGPDFGFFLAAVAMAVYWRLLLPRGLATDLLLLGLLTAFILSPWFKPLYPPTASGLKLHALSKLLWLRLGIASFRYVHEFPVPRAGFWPNGREFAIGFVCAGAFLAVLAPLGSALGWLKWQTPALPAWQLPFAAIGLFCALLLFLAYGEEYLVRGVLQQLLAKAWGSPALSLVITSLCFGAIHLPFRDQFPNWRFAGISAVAGIFYGLAFLKGKSLRAAMVAHAITVTVWNLVFGRSL